MKLSECYYQLGDRIPQTLIRLNPGFGPTVVVGHGVGCVARIHYHILFYLECFEFANHFGLQTEMFHRDQSLRIDMS